MCLGSDHELGDTLRVSGFEQHMCWGGGGGAVVSETGVT